MVDGDWTAVQGEEDASMIISGYKQEFCIASCGLCVPEGVSCLSDL
jgi:hypothetical protein